VIKAHPRRKPLTFGDFVAGVYQAWGERRAIGIVRLAIDAHVIEFRGTERFIVSSVLRVTPHSTRPPAGALWRQEMEHSSRCMNTAWFWASNGCPIRWPEKPRPTRLEGGGRKPVLKAARSPEAVHLAGVENLSMKKTNK
jgi:hypothetical protein